MLFSAEPVTAGNTSAFAGYPENSLTCLSQIIMENPLLMILMCLVSSGSHVKALMLFVTVFNTSVCGYIMVNVVERLYPP